MQTDRVPQQEKNNVVTPKVAADFGVINAFGSSSANDSAGAEEGNKRKYVNELPKKKGKKRTMICLSMCGGLLLLTTYSFPLLLLYRVILTSVDILYGEGK